MATQTLCVSRWQWRRSLIAAAVALAISVSFGCTSVRIPLCPKLAARSYPPNATPSAVNFYAAENAARLNLEISILSPYAATISGRADRIEAFTRNYPLIICAFDPASVIEDESTFLACVANAPTWIQNVQSPKPETLMLRETHFGTVCSQ